jgi:hypothetical protein
MLLVMNTPATSEHSAPSTSHGDAGSRRVVWFPALGLVIAGLAAVAWVAQPEKGRPATPDSALTADLRTWIGQEVAVYIDSGRRPAVGNSRGLSIGSGGLVLDEQSQPIGAEGRLVEVSDAAIVLESSGRVWISRDRVVAIEPVTLRGGTPGSNFIR